MKDTYQSNEPFITLIFYFFFALTKTVNFINVFDTTFFIHTITFKYNFLFFFILFYGIFHYNKTVQYTIDHAENQMRMQ